MSFSLKGNNNEWILQCKDGLQVTADWFDIAYWQQQQQVLGHSTGRNVTWFVGRTSQPLVLRHYYRGGLIGKLLQDTYLFTGVTHSRPYREFVLLQELARLGLPACRAVAARIRRCGLVYRADLLMEQVIDARDLVAHLQRGPLADECWQRIGQTLADFHRHGVYHADLNAHNILLDKAGQVWLIDFDRGQLRQPDRRWQAQNLARLQRSFEKESGRLAVFHYHRDAWNLLHQAYQQAMAN